MDILGLRCRGKKEQIVILAESGVFAPNRLGELILPFSTHRPELLRPFADCLCSLTPWYGAL